MFLLYFQGVYAGIARPTDDGFDIVHIFGGTASEIAPVGKLQKGLPDSTVNIYHMA